VRRSAILLLVMCLFAMAAKADQITLKNGDRITGTIVKSDDKILIVKTDFAGDLNIKWELVASIVSDQTLHLALKDGQTVVGTVKTEDGKFDVATKETGEVKAAKESVAAVRSDAEQKAYDDQMYRLQHPHLTDFWSGALDTGLSLTRGNSDSTTFSLAGKAARVTDRDKISVYTTAIYTKSSVNNVSSVTAHDVTGGIRGDLNVSDRVFVFAFTDFEYNAFQHLDLRNIIGGGFGYHVIKTKDTQFDVFGGGSYNQEYYSSYFLAPPDDTTLQPAITRKSGELVFGESLTTKLSARTSLTEQLSLYPNLTDSGDFRAKFDVTANTKLKNWLGWQITYSDIYITNPPFGLKGNDQVLSTGLRLTFGKGTF